MIKFESNWEGCSFTAETSLDIVVLTSFWDRINSGEVRTKITPTYTHVEDSDDKYINKLEILVE